MDVLIRAGTLAPDHLRQTIGAIFEARPGDLTISLVNESWLSCAVVAEGGVAYADEALGLSQVMASGATTLIDELSEMAASARKARRVFGSLTLPGSKTVMAVATRADNARNWPVPAAARQSAKASGAIIVLAFLPGSDDAFANLIGPAYGLTPSEARLAVILFNEPSVESAAKSLHLSPETVRDRLRTVHRKTGANRRADLLARITELLAGDDLRGAARTALLREAFGLSAAEARIADAVALGLSTPEIAVRDKVSVHTVRAQLDAALEKTGVRKAANLARMVCEICALASWTSGSEMRRIDQKLLIEKTRMIVAPGRRQIAATDYGPSDGAPVLYVPPPYCHRWVRRALVAALQSRGFRPLSLDLPGIGLTDMARGTYIFDAAAADIECTLAALKVPRVRLFAEFGGSTSALIFAARPPDMVEEGVLLMPRPPNAHPRLTAQLQQGWKVLAARADLALVMYEMLRVGAGSHYWKWVQSQISMEMAADRNALADPAFLEERIGEMNASCARGVGGLVATDQAHMAGWQFSSHVGGQRWTVVATGVDPFTDAPPPEDVWKWLPGLRLAKLADAGRLATHTHAGAIADLFTSVRGT